MKLLVVASLLISAGKIVSALPLGAAGCLGGKAAVAGGHVAREPGSLGTIENGGFYISINGERIIDPAISVALSTGVQYTVSLSGADFRGFLFRLQDAGNDIDASEYLAPGGEVGVAQATADGVCPPDVAGVTHTLNDLKPEAAAILMVDEIATYTLDVTVVTRNCAPDSPLASDPNDIVEPCSPANSTYYYTGYTLSVGAPAPSGMPSISANPSGTPSISSVPSKVISQPPSESPSTSPSGSPSVSAVPSEAPSGPPSRAPSVSVRPSQVPSRSPSGAPSDSTSPSGSPSVSSAPTETAAPSFSPLPMRKTRNPTVGCRQKGNGDAGGAGATACRETTPQVVQA